MKAKTTISEITRSYRLEGLLVIIDPKISIEKEVKEERKRIYLEYKRDIDELFREDINLDRSIKKLEKKMFYLEKFRESLKNEIIVKKTLKNELVKTQAKEAKKIILELDKEIFILNINCDLYNEAIRFKRKTIDAYIDAYKEKKTHNHQSKKRMRTKERHRIENLLFTDIED